MTHSDATQQLVRFRLRRNSYLRDARIRGELVENGEDETEEID